MTGELATALAAFQAEMPVVAKSNRAEVPTKNGGKYTYTYADLADVTQAAMPILAKHGLSFTTTPRWTDHGYELVGQLLHSGGGSIDGVLPIGGHSPQEMGSSLTYMRRYLLGCLTGIVTDDDDDGRSAQAAAKRPATRKATPPPVAPPVDDHPGPSDAITPAQIRKMAASMNDLGMTDRDLALAFVADVIGRPVESRNDLTLGEARKVIDALERDLAGARTPA